MTVATLYTVLTAFVVVVVRERIGDAREVTFSGGECFGWRVLDGSPASGGGWRALVTQLGYQMREHSSASTRMAAMVVSLSTPGLSNSSAADGGEKDLEGFR